MTGESILVDFLPDLICLGVDVLICGVVYKIYSKTDQLIKAITAAPKIDLEDDNLCYLMKNHPKLTRTSEGEKALPFVVIVGKVAADDGAKLLENSYRPKPDAPISRGVIKESAIIEHKRTLSKTGFWYDSSRTIHSYNNDIPFWLIPASKSCLRRAKPNIVEVKEYARAARLDLDVVSDNFEAATGSLSDHILGFVAGDRPRGIETTEKMLCEGTRLTAVGELVQTQQGKFKIQQPSNGLSYLLVKDSTKTLLEDLNGESRMLRVVLFLFGGVGVFIVGFAAYRYWKKTEEHRRAGAITDRLEQIIQDRANRPAESRQPVPPAEVSASETGADSQEDSNNSQQCVVCYAQAKEVIFLDCGHVCSCADCAMSIMRTNPVCPICRTSIDRIVPAFIA